MLSGVAGRRRDLLNELLLHLSAQFQTLGPEIVRADLARLTPLIDLVSAARYHNGLLTFHSEGAITLDKEEWGRVITVVKQNLGLTQRAAQRVWLAYMDVSMPTHGVPAQSAEAV